MHTSRIAVSPSPSCSPLGKHGIPVHEAPQSAGPKRRSSPTVAVARQRNHPRGRPRGDGAVTPPDPPHHAQIGAFGGPVGILAGGVIGGVLGGLAGSSIGTAIASGFNNTFLS